LKLIYLPCAGVPLYLSEASPTAIRGIVVGSWQLLLAIGQVIGACVDQGTHNISYPSTASYRIPIGLNFVIPLIVFTCIWFIPESPRWLVSRGRDKQAQRNLERINKGNPDYDSDKVLWEFKEDVRRSEETGGGSWASLFTDKVEVRKLVSTFGVLAGQQIGGVQFIFSYATVIATDLQLANPFLITIIVCSRPFVSDRDLFRSRYVLRLISSKFLEWWRDSSSSNAWAARH
jgi:hypothetical protein